MIINKIGNILKATEKHIVSNINEAKIFKFDLLEEIEKRFGKKNIKIHFLNN